MNTLPPHILSIQSSYANLISEVKSLIGTRDITPQMGLMLACIGDQELGIGEIARRHYYIGTNLSYSLAKLFELELLCYLDDPASDRRKKSIRLTHQGLVLAESIRNGLRREAREAA